MARSAKKASKSKDEFALQCVRGACRLKDHDPDARPVGGSSHEIDSAHIEQIAIDIDTAQDLLYANGQSGGARKLLLVLQGLDTSGKDGTARAAGALQPDGRARGGFQGAHRGGARARLPVARALGG